MRYVISLGLLILGFLMMVFIVSNSSNIGGYYTYFYIGEFFDFPVFVWFIIVIIAVIIATGERKTFISAINALLSKKYIIPPESRYRAIKLFRTIGKAVILAAIFDMLMSFMLILLVLDDPGRLGPMISIALLAPLYAVFINFALVLPMVHILQFRRNEKEKLLISEKQVIDKLLELCYRQGITPEEILKAGEIMFKEEE